MKPNVAKVGMARLAASVLALLCLVAPAFAGDRALLDFIGFSQDARYFAFEEFGIRDGSGLAYSNIYVVDLSTDSWVLGTPIRIEAESEANSLSDVRARASAGVANHIKEFGIDRPVDVAALIGDGVPDNEGKSLVFGAPGYLPWAVTAQYELELRAFEAKSASPCREWFDIDPLGYQLTIKEGGVERLVHRDTALPRSRGCPFDYRIYGVVMPFMGATISQAVAIVSAYPGAFEGPDRRFLAVPLGL